MRYAELLNDLYGSRLLEIQITKDLQNPNLGHEEGDEHSIGAGLAKVISKYGLKVIGRGAEAAVAEYKGAVIKVFSTNSPYIDFVNYVQQNKENQHLPKFSHYVRAIPGTDFAYVRMERLAPVSSSLLLANHAAELAVFTKINPRAFTDDLVAAIEQHQTDTQPDPAWMRLVQDMFRLAAHHRHWLDMKPDSFMLRGQTLVLIDPFA